MKVDTMSQAIRHLSDLLKHVTDAEVVRYGDDPVIEGVTCDSRAVCPGFVFVAIPGAITDGHRYIDDAIRRGAVAIVCERDQNRDDVAEIHVPFSRRALAELSRAFYGWPDRDLFMIGVTATNGKTTTTSMIEHIFEDAGIPTAVVGSVAYRHGDRTVKSTLTTPESTDLHAMLADWRDAMIEVVSMEVSSIAEAQCRVYGIDYDAVAFLNITPDHMPDHGSFEAYFEAKSQLINGVRPGVPAVLNIDDPHVRTLVETTPGVPITMSTDPASGADVFADHIELRKGVPSFDLVIRTPFPTRTGRAMPGSAHIELSVPGRHSVYNAMAAYIISTYYNISSENIIASLKTFAGVERRLQIIYEGDFTMIDDHISDEDNTRKMLEALPAIAEGAPVRIVYAIRGNRGVRVNREVIAQFKEHRDHVNWASFIVTSSEDVARQRDIVHDDERAAVLDDLEAAGYDITYMPNLGDAIERTLDGVEPGDVMVLAGSHNMDRGARIALNALVSRREDLDRDAILAVLDGRIMG
jgi:UDP-N-acetylmuramoyl-L-alanyl-D-glutamate--2,6-diaminopimelate ligase